MKIFGMIYELFRLSRLNKIPDVSVQQSIINSVVFKEGAANEIVAYMEKNQLTENPLYTEFLKYKT